MGSFVRKLRFSFLYAVYVVAFVAAVSYLFFYRPYYSELRAQRTGPLAAVEDPDLIELVSVRHVSPEAMRRLGKVNGDKKSFFIHFEKEKPPDTLRVCCFGDSYTHGEEVDYDHDYPTLLQQLFERRGAGGIEVINFGVGGYGVHQTYMMWDYVGRHFGCDYRLLGPKGFQPRRDTSFGYIHRHWSPYYLHARYVLDGHGDVRLVEVEGDTYGERFDHRFRFLTPWRYLRYDRGTPTFLKVLIPRHRELANPFYYDSRDVETEAFESYGILLRKMAEDTEGGPIFIGHHKPEVAELVGELALPSLGGAHFYERMEFPYIAPVGHASPWGNQLLAEQFFARLTGSDQQGFTVLETIDLEPPDIAARAVDTKAIESYSKIEVELEGTPIGRFTINDYNRFDEVSPTRTDGLLAFRGEEGSLLDAAFAPVSFSLRPGMEVALSLGGHGTLPLGAVRLIDERLNVGVAEIPGLEYPDQVRLFFRGNASLRIHELPDTAAQVLVDGHRVLVGGRGQLGIKQGFWLRPADDGLFRVIHANEGGLVAMEDLADDGILDLVLHHWQDGEIRIPIAGWRKSTVMTAVPVAPIDRPLSIEPEPASRPEEASR